MNYIYRGGSTTGLWIGVVDGNQVYRGLGRSRPCVAILDQQKWLHEGGSTNGRILATIDDIGKYIYHGFGVSGKCLGYLTERYVYLGIGEMANCIGIIDSSEQEEILAGAASLLTGLFDDQYVSKQIP